MKRFRKVLRVVGLIIMMLLASVGIGLTGGVPLPLSNKRKMAAEIKIELVEQKDDENEDEEKN